VRLGGEVDDDVRLLDKGAGDHGISDIAADERVPRVIHQIVQVLEASAVGQLVQRGDSPVGMRRERIADEIAADESGPAGDEDIYHGYIWTVAPVSIHSPIR